jgi:hypothetical protein
VLKETLTFSHNRGNVIGSNYISLKLYSASRNDHEDKFIKTQRQSYSSNLFLTFFNLELNTFNDCEYFPYSYLKLKV